MSTQTHTQHANKQNINWHKKIATRKMQNDLSFGIMHFFPLVLFVLHHIVVAFKTMKQTPTTTAYSWRVAVYSSVFFPNTFEKKGLMTTIWTQHEYSMREEKKRKPSSNVSFWRAHQLTSNSMIAFALQCHAMQNWRMYCISTVFFSLKPKSNVFFLSASFLFCYSCEPISICNGDELDI